MLESGVNEGGDKYGDGGACVMKRRQPMFLH